jgi:5-methylcytosine-specific restriction endonuclease McrA
MRYKTTDDLTKIYRKCAQTALENETSLYQIINEGGFDCDCFYSSPCRWETSGGVQRAALVCAVCGKRKTHGIKKADYPDFDSLPWYDDALRNRVQDYTNNLSSWIWEKRQEAFANQKNDWFIQHSDYLRSPEWQAKRTAVFRRDGYICQGCLTNPAAQVHHITYAHWQHEPLFDLVSVCVQCHDEITEMDRRRRTGAKDVS